MNAKNVGLCLSLQEPGMLGEILHSAQPDQSYTEMRRRLLVKVVFTDRQTDRHRTTRRGIDVVSISTGRCVARADSRRTCSVRPHQLKTSWCLEWSLRWHTSRHHSVASIDHHYYITTTSTWHVVVCHIRTVTFSRSWTNRSNRRQYKQNSVFLLSPCVSLYQLFSDTFVACLTRIYTVSQKSQITAINMTQLYQFTTFTNYFG